MEDILDAEELLKSDLRLHLSNLNDLVQLMSSSRTVFIDRNSTHHDLLHLTEVNVNVKLDDFGKLPLNVAIAECIIMGFTSSGEHLLSLRMHGVEDEEYGEVQMQCLMYLQASFEIAACV